MQTVTAARVKEAEQRLLTEKNTSSSSSLKTKRKREADAEKENRPPKVSTRLDRFSPHCLMIMIIIIIIILHVRTEWDKVRWEKNRKKISSCNFEPIWWYNTDSVFMTKYYWGWAEHIQNVQLSMLRLQKSTIGPSLSSTLLPLLVTRSIIYTCFEWFCF